MSIGWKFPSNNDGQICGISEAGIETFKGSPFSSLAREICQNSLDAREDNSKPVIVEFALNNVMTSRINKFSDLSAALEQALAFWRENEKATRFLNNAVKVANCDTIQVLRISDYNTSGLTGSREKYNTPWQNLVKSSGVSDKGGTSGGSFGIGKSAPFACSDIRTVIYSTLDKYGFEASQGVARLVSFEQNNYITQGIGYYGETSNNSAMQQQFSDGNFIRSEIGTDVYVLGFKKTDNWKEEIITAVLDGFLISIMDNDLVVKVDDIIIDNDTLAAFIDEYKEKSILSYNYYQVLTSTDSIKITENFNGIGNITLRLLFKNDLKRKVLISRSNGMKIFDKQNFPAAIHFAGVLTLDDESVSSYFRKMETPQHDNWEPERLEFPKEIRAGKANLKQLYKWIKDRVIEYGSQSVSDQVDVQGMGDYIPDSASAAIEPNENDPKEDINNKVSSMEVTEVKTILVKRGIQHIEELSTTGEIEAPGFYDEDDSDNSEVTAFVPSGDPNNSSGGLGSQKSGHEDTTSPYNVRKTVSIAPIYIRLFVSDYKRNEYTLILSPAESAENCYVKLSIAGEQSNLKVKVTFASSASNTLVCKNDRILLGKVEKEHKIALKFVIDYNSICSMEAELYGNKV